jgi:hypothetical protein
MKVGRRGGREEVENKEKMEYKCSTYHNNRS